MLSSYLFRQNGISGSEVVTGTSLFEPEKGLSLQEIIDKSRKTPSAQSISVHQPIFTNGWNPDVDVPTYDADFVERINFYHEVRQKANELEVQAQRSSNAAPATPVANNSAADKPNDETA